MSEEEPEASEQPRSLAEQFEERRNGRISSQKKRVERERAKQKLRKNATRPSRTEEVDQNELIRLDNQPHIEEERKTPISSYESDEGRPSEEVENEREVQDLSLNQVNRDASFIRDQEDYRLVSKNLEFWANVDQVKAPTQTEKKLDWDDPADYK